jgi:hypothetical protein
MPAGIQIFNDFGTTQIDDSSPVLALRDKIAVNMVPTSSYWFGGISLPGYQFPLVAVRCASQCWWQFSKFSPAPAEFYFRTNVDTPVTAYCFDRVQLTSTAGFSVWDGAGNIMFDAGSKPAIVINSSPGSMSEPVPPGREHAVCVYMMRLARTYVLLEDPPRRISERSIAPSLTTGASTTSFNPASIFSTFTQATSDPVPPDWESRADTLGLIMDVTGY